ncbi:hypothetical protein [Sphingobacterium kyonggiense]
MWDFMSLLKASQIELIFKYNPFLLAR